MLSRRRRKRVAQALANALLAGEWAYQAMAEQAATCLGQKWRWRLSMVRRLLAEYPQPPPAETLLSAIEQDTSFRRAVDGPDPPRVRTWFTRDASMTPAPAWDVPPLATPADLAALLRLGVEELYWLADCHGREHARPEGAQRHYRYHWAGKRRGGRRLIEAPKTLLKTTQRRLLHSVLAHIPPHPAARGFRPGHSILDYVSPHVGRSIVLRFDIRDFFASVPASRVHALFRTAGYPLEVTRLLTGLCTNTVPGEVCAGRADAGRYVQPHLPQGAPTSPALANLCCYRLDLRLAAMAEVAGASYTRYADDLAFSGDGRFARGNARFAPLVWTIVREEGFALNHRKTRVMRQGVRQRLAGLVVNEHPNVGRGAYDRLKATLTNCLRHGPESQNRAGRPDFHACLRGQIAFVHQVNPQRAARLERLFDRIDWGRVERAQA